MSINCALHDLAARCQQTDTCRERYIWSQRSNWNPSGHITTQLWHKGTICLLSVANWKLNRFNVLRTQHLPNNCQTLSPISCQKIKYLWLPMKNELPRDLTTLCCLWFHWFPGFWCWFISVHQRDGFYSKLNRVSYSKASLRKSGRCCQLDLARNCPNYNRLI